jgi:hypothetical protein
MPVLITKLFLITKVRMETPGQAFGKVVGIRYEVRLWVGGALCCRAVLLGREARPPPPPAQAGVLC